MISLLQSQPVYALLGLVVLAFIDGNLGAWVAVRAGVKFSWQRYATFLENSVGAQRLLIIASSVVGVYLTQGQQAAWAALGALVVLGGTAYLSVLADVYDKIRVLTTNKS